MNLHRVEEFLSWTKANLPRWRKDSAAQVAEDLGDAILRLDEGLGVEVAKTSEQGTREVIVTAFSEPRLFPLVQTIVAGLGDVPGWNFVALKPARGFAFTISLGKHQLKAKELHFVQIPEVEVAIQLLLPKALFETLPSRKDAQELAWLTVETGLGEELCSTLQHVEFASLETALQNQPITDLANLLRQIKGDGHSVSVHFS